MAVAASSSTGPEGRVVPSGSILLDLKGYIADCSNATTARSKTSTGLPISVAFYIARPPALSHFFVHCPGLDLAALPVPPKAITSDADLVLLRVPLDPDARSCQWHNDYFVYRMHPQRPRLDLLPNPRPARFGDDEIAILSCGDGFVVAGLNVLPMFELRLCRFTCGKPPGRWTSQMVSVEERVRDRVCPMPDSADRKMYHMTSKTITIGGEKGTIGWVDLWRGILLCDVLSDNPRLRDIPLPVPAKGNWSKFLNYCPYFFRDVTFSKRRDMIKYVEMEITKPDLVPITASRPEPASYLEWVKSQEECPQPQPQSYTLLPGNWTATTYSMQIPVSSWDNWCRGSSIHLADLKLPDENTRHYKLLHKLISSSGKKDQEATEATMFLGYLNMGYPTIVDDDDTIYLLSKGTCRGSMQAVVSVDVGANTLQGVAKLDTEMHASFQRCCLASEISKHLKTKGTRASGQAEDIQNP